MCPFFSVSPASNPVTRVYPNLIRASLFSSLIGVIFFFVTGKVKFYSFGYRLVRFSLFRVRVRWIRLLKSYYWIFFRREKFVYLNINECIQLFLGFRSSDETLSYVCLSVAKSVDNNCMSQNYKFCVLIFKYLMPYEKS